MAREFLLGTKPTAVLSYKRSKRDSDLAGSAAFGYCVSRNLHYIDYKLVTPSIINGVPFAYYLVPSKTDERLLAETVLSAISNIGVFCDKNCTSDEWQTDQLLVHVNRSCVPVRVNQKTQKLEGFDCWLNALRERT